MLDNVTVNVSQTLVPTSQAGFGTCFALSYNATWPGARIRTFGSDAEVAATFANARLPERLISARLFSQSPRPRSLKLARADNKPTRAYTLTAIAPTTTPSYTYRIRIGGDTVAETEVTWVSDGTPTDAEYASAAVAAINGVAAKNWTATGAASPVTITADAAGADFWIEVVDVATQRLADTTADPGITADLTAALLEDRDLYFAINNYGSRAHLIALGDWVDANGRMAIFGTGSHGCILDAVGGDDPMDRCATNNYHRTGVAYHGAPQRHLAAAWVGRVSPRLPGRVNFSHKPLVGVSEIPLSATHVANIRAKAGNGYDQNTSGRYVTFDGRAGDGTFLDQTRSIDWIVYEIRRRQDDLLAREDIIGWTRAGVEMLRGELTGALDAGIEQGVVSPDVPYVITIPDPVDDIDVGVSLTRAFPPCDVRFTGSGAINNLTINLTGI